MITLLHPADILNKGQIYLCPFGLRIDSKRPHVFARLSYFTPECSVDKPLSNNLELIFFNRSLVLSSSLIREGGGGGGGLINFQREPHSFQWVRKEVSRPQQSILRGDYIDYRGLTVN